MSIDPHVRIFPVNVRTSVGQLYEAVTQGILYSQSSVESIVYETVLTVEINRNGGIIGEIVLLVKTVGSVVEFYVTVSMEGSEGKKNPGGETGPQTHLHCQRQISGK